MKEVHVTDNIIRWGHIWSTKDHFPTTPEDFKSILKESNGNCWIYRRHANLMVFEEGVFVESGPMFMPEMTDDINILDAEKIAIFVHLKKFQTEEYIKITNPIGYYTKRCYKDDKFLSFYKTENGKLSYILMLIKKYASEGFAKNNMLRSTGDHKWEIVTSNFSEDWLKRSSSKG
jgi:hypothetical protein